MLWIYAYINNLLFISLWMALMMEMDELPTLRKLINNIFTTEKK